MDSERWRRIDNLLQSALARPPAEREDFLRQACAGDESLRREVESLAASHDEAGSFLDRPPGPAAAQAFVAEQNSQAPGSSVSLTGQIISHYRVIEKLGAGGMGVV
jgi:hypothetical protein